MQPGLSRDPRRSRIAASERLTSRGWPAGTPVTLVVWGESSVGYDLDSYPALRLRPAAALSAAHHEQILASQDAAEPRQGQHSKV